MDDTYVRMCAGVAVLSVCLCVCVLSVCLCVGESLRELENRIS